MDVELDDLDRRTVDLPRIDTSVRRTNMGGSRSMPPSPTPGHLSAPAVTRRPSIPHAGDLAALRQTATHSGMAHPRASFVQSGRMTKVPHYGRLRSVTARVLRMMDPRTLAKSQKQQQQQQQQKQDAEADDGTAAGVLGRSVVDTMRDAAGRHRQQRQRRLSVGSVPAGGLSRLGSRESHGRLRLSMDSRVRRSLERVQSRASSAPSMQSAGEAVAIAIPMPGFFLSAESDDWTGGHSFRQRMRAPHEAVTVPASLTKRVHYEVSYDYPKNAISTARYNVVTFLPAQLAAQFSKVANIYFLFIAALQQVPGWSTTGRWTTILPLSVFVSLSIAHEAFDDIRRHRMDHAENAQRTRVLKVKVHDRERVSFSFRDLRHRGSHSIHSFRMRSSQSIHDIGRSAVDRVARWAVAAASIGTTVREHVGAHLAAKRRKKRELEDSDDEDEQPLQVDRAAGDGDESLLRRQITRGVLSMRSWRGNVPGLGSVRRATLDDNGGVDGDYRLGEIRLADSPTPLQESANDVASYPAPHRPVVAFNDEVEERTYYDDDQQQANPLPENMSCRWKKKRWENVQVGDLLMICKDDWIPADCVVVASTGFDGTCFVETAALDGETTLKQKQALEATNSAVQTAEQLAAFDAFTYVEPPSPELYSFEGYMEIGGSRHPLTPNQLLLRGSVLRNTAYVFAQVVYAGEHSRLRLNATRNVRTKAPQIQRITNRIVVLVFALLLVLCVIFAALGIRWNDRSRRGHWYLHAVHMPATALLFGYIVMMNALIPISLYVTLEAVKIFQCWFIQQDAQMYHAASDTRAEARTTAINEDLGMVRYVFSDKTGTLTENIMKLRALMVAGFSFLHIDLDRLTPEPISASPASKHPPPNSNNALARQLFNKRNGLSHRRQHSMPISNPAAASPGPPHSPRALQHLAAANRASGGPLSLGSSFSRGHSRGMSASVLRSPLQNEVPLLNPLDRQSPSPSPDAIDLDLESDTPEPTARDDAPVSDLQALPSSRRIMNSVTPPTQVFRARAEWFLRCLALCHTVQPDRDPLTGRITGYQATSPDEKALVAAAAELGYVMNNRAGPLVQLRVVASERMRDFNATVVSSPESPDDQQSDHEDHGDQDDDNQDLESEQSFDRGVPAPHPTDRLGSYEVLDVLEFSSARKRMSVILRCADGRIVMMSKGADSAIWPRLARTEQLVSDACDTSFRPRPTPPTDKFSAPATMTSTPVTSPPPLMLRRKLSQPSAAYLHSRSASASSTPPPPPPDESQEPPQPEVARLADGSMYFGQLGATPPGEFPSASLSAPPMSAPAHGSFAAAINISSNGSFAPQHRRLMSDSQFSALSDASSFADTQGQVEIPPSFGDPTAQEEEWARTRALEALHQFSTEGLRTLVYAHKEIPQPLYDAWHVRYTQACTALSNRQQQVEAVCEEIESNLLLSGVSAIEDRLQEGVPETIYMLRRAGIRVWMLTGDKVETAINIAKSCRLIGTDVVETTELNARVVEQNSDKMLVLLMQSLTDVDELDRVVTQALGVAKTMGASVDQRFERRSRVDKLRRGMKKFGNMLNVVVARKKKKEDEAAVVASHNNDDDGAADTLKPMTLSESSRSSDSRPSDVTRGILSKQGSKLVSSEPDQKDKDQDQDRDKRTDSSLAVVIDGETLSLLEKHAGLLERFLSLGTLCDAVICSRVSPSQKALIVHNMRVRCEGGGNSSKSAKDSKKSSWLRMAWRPIASFFRHDSDRYMVTLAIGDGGNDIAMIQEAHAGIGIAGQEGLQASRAADFSIGQFRFLQRLLLVHGRWSYVRVSMFIMGTFYKCMAFYLTQLIYQFYTGFSGTSLYESWTLSMYNTLFSILPVLVVGIFEQDLKPDTLLAFPELYRDMGPRNHLFTVPEFLRRVVVVGLLHAVIAAYFPFAGGLLMGHNGTTNDQYVNSLMVYSIIFLTVTFKIAYIDVRRWVVFSHISVILSLTLWFGWNGVLNHIYPKSPSDGYFVLGVFDMLLSKAPFWFQWVIFTAVALCVNVLVNLVYSVRDPVEHRITSWVAFERRKEHGLNKERRKQWLADHKLGNFS